MNEEEKDQVSNRLFEEFRRLIEEGKVWTPPSESKVSFARLVDEFNQYIPPAPPDARSWKLIGLPQKGTYSHCYGHNIEVFYDFPTRIGPLHEYSYWCADCNLLVQGLYEPVGDRDSRGRPGVTVYRWVEHGLTEAALFETKFDPSEVYMRSWYELAKLWRSGGTSCINMSCLRGGRL